MGLDCNYSMLGLKLRVDYMAYQFQEISSYTLLVMLWLCYRKMTIFRFVRVTVWVIYLMKTWMMKKCLAVHHFSR